MNILFFFTLNPSPSLLAERHICSAGIAGHYAEIAGDQADDNYAYRDALRYYKRVLDLIHPDDWEKRYEIYKECEGCAMYIGDLASQVNALEQMSLCADKLDNDTKRLQTLVIYSMYYQRHRQNESLEATVTKGVTLAKKLGDIEREFRLYENLTLALGERRLLADAFQSLENCKEIVEQSDNIKINLAFLMASALLHFYANELEPSLLFQHEYLRLAEAHTLLFEIFRGCANIAVSYKTIGDYDLAERYYVRALEIAHRRGDIGSEVLVKVNLTNFYNGVGEFERALDIGNEALNNSQQIGRSNFYRIATIHLGMAHHMLGDIDKAELMLTRGIDLCQQASDTWHGVLCWNQLGHLKIVQEQFMEALSAFEKAEALQADMNQTNTLTESCAGLAVAYMGLGDIDHAKQYTEKALTYMHPEKIDDSWSWAQAYLYIGFILDQIQDERAIMVLQQALQARDARASKIGDEARRQTYLSEVSANHTIGVLYELIVNS